MTSVSAVHPERNERSRWRARALARLVAAGVALASRAASADDLVDLRWTSPSGCPRAGAVQDQIRTIVSHSRVVSRLRAEGEVTQASGRYRLTLVVYEGNTRRERIIDSDSCAALAGAAAVALGLLLRGETSSADSTFSAAGGADGDTGNSNAKGNNGNGAASETSTTRPNTEKAPPTAGTAAKPDRPARNASADQDQPVPGQTAESGGDLRLVLRAPIGAVDAGLLPHAALNAGAGIGMRYEGFHFGTSLRFFASETSSVSSPSQVGVDIDRIAMDVWACRAWSSGRFELGPCLTLGLDRFGARGTGPRVDARSAHFVAFAPGAGVQAHLRIAEWFAVFVTAGAGIETSRARLTIGNGVGEVERLGSTRLSAGLGTEWIL